MLFRLILIAILIYLVISFLRRIFDSSSGSESGWYKNKEGEVTVEDQGEKKKTINKDEGDYVDYEEVE